jgi:hypothetical protein
MPPHASSYADPYSGPRYRSQPSYIGPSGYAGHRGPSRHEPRRRSGETTSTYGGGGTAFCVRTCDGRFFPIRRRAGMSVAELCQSFCPSSKTMVFSGSRIDHAVAPNGQRYASLKGAYLYRERVVEGCTCNGNDPLGLAQVEIADDPTLRPGDIVATNDGLATYHGRSSKGEPFTPIDPSKSEWARRLSEIKVRPASPPPKLISPLSDREAAVEVRTELRRAQLSR